MIETPAQRAELHRKRAEFCASQATEHGSEAAPQYRVAEALHELGVTLSMAVQVQRIDAGDLEALGADLVALSAAVDKHQQAVAKAQKGLSPWGELLRVGEELKLAVEKVMKR